MRILLVPPDSGTAIDSTDFDLWFERRFGKRPEGSEYELQLELDALETKVRLLRARIASVSLWEAQRHAALIALQNSTTIRRNIQ